MQRLSIVLTGFNMLNIILATLSEFSQSFRADSDYAKN
jgi:hypothetical protein